MKVLLPFLLRTLGHLIGDIGESCRMTIELKQEVTADFSAGKTERYGL